MVYFTCGQCGEQLKKPNVEKHYNQKCRSCNLLTCIDCLKDFYGDEYKKHNQCMSEAQRYSKEGRQGWDPNQGQGNKGEKKQQSWIERLRVVVEEAGDLDYAVRNIVDTIMDHDNIPRKRPKFINFVKNIMRNKASMPNIEQTWELFAQAIKPPEPAKPAAEPAKPAAEEPVKVEEQPTKNKKKRPLKEEIEVEAPVMKKKKKDKKGVEKENEKPTSEEDETQQPKKKKKKKDKEVAEKEESMDTSAVEQTPSKTETTALSVKFDWDATISDLLKQKGEMKIKKLKKRVINHYLSCNPNNFKSQEELGSKFDKKLKKKKYKINNDKVQLAPNHISQEDDAAPDTNEVEMSDAKTNGLSAVNGHQEDKPSPVKNPFNNKDKLSFNKWEGIDMGSDAQTEKFRRLMGIKTNKPPQAIAGVAKRNDKKIFNDLEQGFEKARNSHFRAKGKGLGFN